jgi:hypothetical protein
MDDLEKKISKLDASELQKVVSFCKNRKEHISSVSNFSLKKIELKYFENDKYLVHSTYTGVELCKYENNDVIKFGVDILDDEYLIYTLRDNKGNKFPKWSFCIGIDAVLEMLNSFSNPSKEAVEYFEKILKLKTDINILKNTKFE